jgi:NAD(P)-dependent dehydrogenase (short-subunit alcohol dehydrogenase family)
MNTTDKRKVAIVTGAGQGIGLRICEMLAASGKHVLLNDINPELCQLAATKVSLHGTCTAMPGDAGDTGFIKEMVEQAATDFGDLEIAMSIAGITLFGAFNNYPVADFDRVMQVNLRGTFYLAQAASNQMIKQGKGGSLLFTSSVVVLVETFPRGGSVALLFKKSSSLLSPIKGIKSVNLGLTMFPEESFVCGIRNR